MQLEKHIRLIALSLGIALVILEIAMVSWMSEPSFAKTIVQEHDVAIGEPFSLALFDASTVSANHKDDCLVAALNTTFLDR